ncbi:MAG TPA: helix-turn-helix domain-containing protein [Pseudonocardiaceae bacterium]|jgi:AcrR family transcriptional regulator|nr:helix-turn-helix domain-containing protein [Pseudonocardiaceae bacterium]
MTSSSFLLDEILRAPETDAVSIRILDAALGQYLAHGLRRTSVDDVARAAGIGRATVYRRFATRDELIQAVLVRECRRFFAEIASATEALPTLADRLVEGFVVGLRGARRHSLLGRMLASEPEACLPFLTVQGGPVLGVVREFLVHQYMTSPEVVNGSTGARAVNPAEVAEILVRLSISLVLTPDTCLALGTDEEVRATARRYLAPLVTNR